MRIKISLPIAASEELKAKILEGAEKVEHENTSEEDWEVVSDFWVCLRFIANPLLQAMLIDPGQFRAINELLQQQAEGRGGLETLTFAAAGSTWRSLDMSLFISRIYLV